MDRGEFQQDSVLKQLEVLKEEEKEFQNLKVRIATGWKSQLWNPDFSPDALRPRSRKQGRETRRPEVTLRTGAYSLSLSRRWDARLPQEAGE